MNTLAKRLTTRAIGIGLLLLLPLGTKAAENTAQKSLFKDVNGSTTLYIESINTLTERGILKGYDDKTFRPKQEINRAEFTKIIIEAAFPNSEKISCASQFSDVPTDAWYAPYVCIAKAKGIIAGYDDGTFKPSASVNFAEAAKIVAESFHLPIPTYKTNFAFIDSPDGQYWFRKYIDALGEKKAVPEYLKSFDSALHRDEMAYIIQAITDDAFPNKTTFGANGNFLYILERSSASEKPTLISQREEDIIKREPGCSLIRDYDKQAWYTEFLETAKKNEWTVDAELKAERCFWEYKDDPLYEAFSGFVDPFGSHLFNIFLAKESTAETDPVEWDGTVVFPWLSSKESNDYAQTQFGTMFLKAKSSIESSDEIKNLTGDIVDIRLNRGANAMYAWMDQDVIFTFLVTGKKETAIVHIRYSNVDECSETATLRFTHSDVEHPLTTPECTWEW